MLKNLSDNTKNLVVEAFSTSNVVFLLALQPEHHHTYESIINNVESNWVGQMYSTKSN